MASPKREDQDSQFAALRLAAIVESSDDAIIAKDLDGIITDWNRGAERLFGYLASEVIGKPVAILIPQNRHAEELEILARIRRGERVEHYETIRQRRDGSLVDISLTVSPIVDDTGRVIGASKIARDITSWKLAEERQRLLIGELHHRIKNLFAVSVGIVSMCARSAASPAEMAELALARLRALDRANSLTLPPLPDQSSRVENSTSLHSLIETIVSPHDEFPGGRSQVSVTGPDIEIMAGEVTAFALVLNELATNATKHGALSDSGGRIAIEGRKEDDRFVLSWTEAGSRPITEGDRKEGFGTTLLRGAVEGQLGGTISYDWQPDAVRILFSVPLRRLMFSRASRRTE